jgi:hypothetical protein
MSLPDLPKIPKFPKRLTSSELDGSISVPSGSVALRESQDILSLIDCRNNSLPLSVASDSPIIRYHGCRSCPHYGSSFCFEKVVPPALFADGICLGRLNEVLDIVVLNGSTDSLKIRKQEAIDRLRKHIIVLENNLADYSLKRFELVKDLESRPLKDSDGDPITSENHPSWIAARADRELKLKEFDSYQRGLQVQIQSLSAEFTKLLQTDAKLETGEKITIQMSPLSLGRMIRESKDKVIDV